jgi:hypothetical protein
VNTAVLPLKKRGRHAINQLWKHSQFRRRNEKIGLAFYSDAALKEACKAYSELFSGFAQEAQSNIKTLQRTRRENITEMILENSAGFTRVPYCLECGPAAEMDAAEVLEAARKLEDRSARYYTAATDKLKIQREVPRALKLIGKKHISRQAKIKTL